MIFTEILKRAEKLALDNSPAILTGIGVAGTVTTAVLTGRASYKVARHLSEGPPIEQYTKKELVKEVWTYYIPPVAAGATTIAAIVFANRIGMRKAAAMAAAFQLSEKAFGDYREKVVEQVGKNKEQVVRDEVAKDAIANTPNREVFIYRDGEQLCFDKFTGRYFKSSMEEIKKAENDLNYELLRNGSASLSDFFVRLGLPTSSMTDQIGWFSDHLLEVQHTTALSDDDRPCIVIDYHTVPIQDPGIPSWRDHEIKDCE